MSAPIKACVIGNPIDHSLSPMLHGFWLKQYGINGTYTAQRVLTEELDAFFLQLRKRDYAGCNITLPHKEAAMKYMDEVSDVATKAGAINTVIVQQNGTLYGTNTDVYGFRQNMVATIGEDYFANKQALVLGAGGAARGVCLALQTLGCRVSIANRTKDKAETIAESIGKISVIDWEEKEEALSQTGVLINTTSLGLVGSAPLTLSLAALSPDAVVSDIVYKPLHTPLLQQAALRGNKIVTGIGMLLYQAVPGFEAWFGVKPQVTQELEQYMVRVVT